MKNTLFVILCFMIALPVFSQERQAFTVHPKGEAVRCYEFVENSRSKKIRYKIYPLKEECNAGAIVQCVSSHNDKYLVVVINNEHLYVEKGCIAVNTRNYGGKTLNLYKEPDKASVIIYSTDKEHTAPIFNINGDWLYICLEDDNGKTVYGWIEPEMQCGNPFTTCP